MLVQRGKCANGFVRNASFHHAELAGNNFRSAIPVELVRPSTLYSRVLRQEGRAKNFGIKISDSSQENLFFGIAQLLKKIIVRIIG